MKARARGMAVGRPSTILMVDDVAMFREFGALALAGSGRVFTAARAEEALEILRSEDIGLVITDVAMPGMDGVALCCALKADASRARIPVVLLVSGDDTGERARALRAGADDVLAKPLSRAALTETATRYLRFDPARGLPRVDVWESVQIRGPRGENSGTLRNVSRGGLFVETDSGPPLHSEVELCFHLPGTHTPVTPTAEVVWLRDGPPGQRGMGLRFLSVDGATEHWLDDYVHERIRVSACAAPSPAP